MGEVLNVLPSKADPGVKLVQRAFGSRPLTVDELIEQVSRPETEAIRLLQHKRRARINRLVREWLAHMDWPADFVLRDPDCVRLCHEAVVRRW